jgi:hypothetical protein
MAKVAVVRETCMGLFRVSSAFVTWAAARRMYTLVTTEGIDGPRASLESSLADEERREAHKCL